MKIALNHTRFSRSGGVERFLCHLADHLLARGHEVHFFGLRRDEDTNPDVIFHRVPRIRGTRSTRVLSFAYFSRTLLQRESFDLIQGCGKTIFQHVVRDGSGSRRAYEESQSISSLARMTPGRYAQLWIDRRKYREGAYEAVIAISRFVKDQIVADYGVPADRITVIHNGCDTTRFHPEVRDRHRDARRGELGLPLDAFVVLLVASDLERKGTWPLLRALVDVPEATLVVIGGQEPDIEPYRTLAGELGVLERVRFLGRRGEIETWHGVADCFALPSRFDAIANAALEAMASGLPVLVSASDGVCELVEDGVNGRIVEDPLDDVAIGKALATMTSRERCREMGARSREIAEEYSLPRQLDKYVELFEGVVERRGKSSCSI